MNIPVAKLTILFDAPFWIGLYERTENGRYEVAKFTFGAEPKDCEVYVWLLTNWRALRFSPSIRVAGELERRINPKRMQRLIQQQTAASSVGTKAQQALKLQQEAGKLVRKTNAKEAREAAKERQFQLRQEKQREKHKGR